MKGLLKIPCMSQQLYYTDTTLRLYKSLVRPQLAYCIQVSTYAPETGRWNWINCKEDLQNELGPHVFEPLERLKGCGLTTLARQWEQSNRSYWDHWDGIFICIRSEVLRIRREETRHLGGTGIVCLRNWEEHQGLSVSGSRVVEFWSSLDDSAVSVNNIMAFKKGPGKCSIGVV